MPSRRRGSRTSGSVDVRAEAVRLAETLKHPHRWTLCSECMTHFLDSLPAPKDDLSIWRSECGPLLTALLAFISAERPTSNWSQISLSTHLMENRARCQKCGPMNYSAHSIRRFMQEQYRSDPSSVTLFETTFAMAVEFLNGVLTGLSASYMSRDKAFGSKRGLWPATADELFPLGAHQTITGLCSWYVTHPLVPTANLIHIILELHRPLVLPVLLDDRNRRPLIEAFETFYTLVVLHHMAKRADLFDLERIYVPKTPPALAAQYMGTAHLLLYTIAFGQDHDHDDLQTFLAGHEQRLYQAMRVILLSLSLVGEMPEQMVLLACRVYSLCERGADSDLPFFFKGMPVLGHLESDPYTYLYRSMPYDRRDCYGPGCGMKVHNSATGRAFSRCGRCRFVQYCSKECQRKDWQGQVENGLSFPHKHMCDMLHELTLIVTQDMTQVQFVAACVEHCYPVERANTVVMWLEVVRSYKGVMDRDVLKRGTTLGLEIVQRPSTSTSATVVV